jgi:putative nucleotidyltransferase with HDIG domain
MSKIAILNKIESISEAPTMITIAMEIDRISRLPETSAAQIGAIVRSDPALTAKILKIANSALYASSNKIYSLQQAISRLGYNEIRQTAISIAVINSFKNYFVDYDKFWLHSITSAFIAVELQKISNFRGSVDLVYNCGLLHDIGVLIFDQYFSTLYKKIFDITIEKQADLQLIERKLLGIDHAEVGALILEKWKLPEIIVDVVKFHHEPQKSQKQKELSKLIYLANFICNNRGIGNGTGFFPEGFYDDIWDDLGLSVEDIPEIIKNVKKKTDKAKELLRLGGE